MNWIEIFILICNFTAMLYLGEIARDMRTLARQAMR
jgi:hypothetical protein